MYGQLKLSLIYEDRFRVSDQTHIINIFEKVKIEKQNKELLKFVNMKLVNLSYLL